MTDTTRPPRVCVLLATYNGDAWLEAQLDSLLAQTGVELNVLISDDASQDNSYTLSQRYADKHACIDLLPQHPGTGSAAGNFFRLLCACHCDEYDYIAFCDQDDIWSPNKLISAITALTQHGADGYSSNVEAVWPDGRRVLINKAQPQKKADFLFESPGPGCTFVLTRELSQELRRFVQRHQSELQRLDVHDWFIYAYARSRHYTWYIDARSFVQYRQHEHNTIGANIGGKALFKRVRQVISGEAIQKVIQLQYLLYDLEPSPQPPFRVEPTRGSLLMLACRSRHCRRKITHQLAMAFCVIMLGLKPTPLRLARKVRQYHAPRPTPRS